MAGDEFWKSWLVFWFLAGPILLSCISFVFGLYLSRRHLNSMMNNLKSSRFIYLWGEGLRRQEWFGRLAVLTQVAGIVLMPRIHFRYGEVNEAEIKNSLTTLNGC